MSGETRDAPINQIQANLSKDVQFGNIEEIANKVNDNMAGNMDDISTDIENIFQANVSSYINGIMNSLLYNDVHNTNLFVLSGLDNEMKRLVNLKSHLVNTIHVNRQKYMENVYTLTYNSAIVSIIQFSLLVYIAIALLIKMSFDINLPMTYVTLFSCILLGFYLYFMIHFISAMSIRRRDDWNRFYFPKNIPKKSTSSSS